MKNETTTLTVSVLTPHKVPHYLLIKKNIACTTVNQHQLWLQAHDCIYDFNCRGNKCTITIYEPNVKPAEIIAHNNSCFQQLSITDAHKVARAIEVGDAAFWKDMTDKDIVFVKYLLTAETSTEIGVHYIVGYKCIEAWITVFMSALRIKYPNVKLITREDLRNLCITLSVYVPDKCITCQQLI